MEIEIGPFRPIVSWATNRNYACGVVISSNEFPRLKFGCFEDPNCLTPCISWCHDEIGFGYHDWCSDGGSAGGGSQATLYFAKYSDAVMFLLRWSAD